MVAVPGSHRGIVVWCVAMEIVADFHVHSRYSIATAKTSDLEHLDLWGRYKGLTVVGTGDCTHPEWLKELTAKLTPVGEGVYGLQEGLALPLKLTGPHWERVPPVRFVVTDYAAELPVTYTGILPDLFSEGQGVVAEGSLLPDGTYRFRLDAIATVSGAAAAPLIGFISLDDSYCRGEITDPAHLQTVEESELVPIYGTAAGTVMVVDTANDAGKTSSFAICWGRRLPIETPPTDPEAIKVLTKQSLKRIVK